MAKIWYGHFDSTPEDKRLLLAEDWARYIRGFITDGIRNGGTCLQITAPETGGMKVRLDNGTANVQGYIFMADSDLDGRYYDVPVPAAHNVHPRIDRVVLRLDRTIGTRSVTPQILLGVAAANPTPPGLTRNANIWEMSLAQIRVDANTPTIAANKIIDERFQTDLCGLMNSVLGLDPSAWQAQFDVFMLSLKAADDAFLAAQLTKFTQQLMTQSYNWESQYSQQGQSFAVWFASIQANLPTYAGFDFDNLWLLPGTTKTTKRNADGSVTVTLKVTADGKNVAALNVVFSTDKKTITETQTVYQSNGTSALWQRTKTTVKNADGSVTEGVV